MTVLVNNISSSRGDVLDLRQFRLNADKDDLEGWTWLVDAWLWDDPQNINSVNGTLQIYGPTGLNRYPTGRFLPQNWLMP